MREFEAIRPYRDDEVADVIARLVRDSELLQLLATQRFPRLARWSPAAAAKLVSLGLRREAKQIHSVDELQHRLEPYLDQLIERSTLKVTYSGLEQLDKGQPHLFLANHRDIAMDPAFVNYALYHAGHPTPRIAIGDNLLQRPFVADLMRLNKCFIVHRSLTGRREKLLAYQTLSAYINYSIGEGHSIWIAQAEGRAKDGKDQTDSAIIKMLCMSRKDEPFDEVIHSLSVVPVSIAYEWDPCDQMKAHELAEKGLKGSYTKAPGEDDRSIAMGLTGYKGRVHVAFGEPLAKGIADAKQAAREVDRQILSSYRLYASNYLAFERVLTSPGVAVADWREQFDPDELAQEQARFEERLAACPEAERPYWLLQYANPVISRGLINSR